VLWRPHPHRVARSNLASFMRWLELRKGLRFDTYDDLWVWSVNEIEAFWEAIWEYFLIKPSVPYTRVLKSRRMPGAQWFCGARLNYAEHVLRHERPGVDAFLFAGEAVPLSRVSWPELGGKVRVLATQLRKLGVKPGDRVVGCLPNVPEAVISLLAAASIGAVWCGCSPEYGALGLLERLAPVTPKVLVCCASYRYGGKRFDRMAVMQKVIDNLPSLRHVIQVPQAGQGDDAPLLRHAVRWHALFDHPDVKPDAFEFEQVAFDHPLWILFTSGATGLPKPIVHGHGGILLENLKHLSFNFDVHPRQRIFFYTSTAWMMWNFLVGALLSDVVPVFYDGHPAHPDASVLWRLIESAGVTLFGTSPAYIRMLQRQSYAPKEQFSLPQLEALTLAGSPVGTNCMAWCYEHIKQDMWVSPGSGGTEACTGFVGGVVTLPVRAGEIQARALGCAVSAFNDRGQPVLNEVGELVITEPMPSMPLHFWRDPGDKRYREAYFERFPGLWAHGDQFRLNKRGACFVLGRSDAVLNRHGVRIGSTEIYRALAHLDEVDDALVVNLELSRGRFFMPLFVKLRDGVRLTDDITACLRARLAEECSPRHVPDRILQVSAIPYTRNGKKMEVPVKRILLGVPVERAAGADALADVPALEWFVRYQKRQTDYRLG